MCVFVCECVCMLLCGVCVSEFVDIYLHMHIYTNMYMCIFKILHTRCFTHKCAVTLFAFSRIHANTYIRTYIHVFEAS